MTAYQNVGERPAHCALFTEFVFVRSFLLFPTFIIIHYRCLTSALARQAKLGASCGVQVPVGYDLASHPYHVLHIWRRPYRVILWESPILKGLWKSD